MRRYRPALCGAIFLGLLCALIAGGCGPAAADPAPAVPVLTAAPPLPTDTPSPTRTDTPVPTRPIPTATHTPLPTATATAILAPAHTPTLPPAPHVVASFPIEGDEGVPADTPLILVFDQPMDEEGLSAGLRITPAVGGTAELREGRTYILSGISWPPDTPIQVTLEGARSQAGARLEGTWTLSFASKPEGRVSLPILMYHRIMELPQEASASQLEWTTAPDTFAAHVRYLAENGYHVVGLGEVVGYLDLGEPLPARPVVITFDDGYRDFLDTAWPMLAHYDMRPTLFVIPSHVDYGAFLKWEELHELASAGVAIGSHTLDHVGLKGLAEDELRRQIADSKAAIEEHLGVSAEWLSYPYGSYDEAAVHAAQEAGYHGGVNINPSRFQRRGEAFRLNRLHFPYYATLEDFARALH